VIYRNKYHAMRVTQFLTPLLALIGLQQIVTGRVTSGAIILFGSALIGLVASILAHYYNARQDDANRSQKIAVETLARLARQQQKGKNHPWRAKH
jgi:hypothetical protein